MNGNAMMKPIIFNAQLYDIKLVHSQGVIRIIFERDDSVIPHEARSALYDLLHAKEKEELVIAVTTAEAAKENVKEREQRERGPAERFYLGFLLDNHRFWTYLDTVGSHPTIKKVESFEDAKDVFRNLVGVESLADCPAETFEAYVNNFNDWLTGDEG